jgi:tetratricopeptide (TPR) repeat protein
MKNLLWMPFAFLLLIGAGCGSGETEEVEENDSTGLTTLDTGQFLMDLKALELEIDANLQTPDPELLKKAVTSFQDFAGIFPDDPKAPDYLFKASDYALSTKQPEKSVKILERIMKEYPDYSLMEDVMYSRASHLDIELRDTTLAKEAYQDFIDKFPNATNKVLDAQFRIQTISYTIEELGDKYMEDLEKASVQ